jgi:hypothetical protein
MRKPGHGTLTRRTVIASATAVAAVVAGGGYALASTNASAPTPGKNGVSLSYIVGSSVNVAPHATGQGATECASGMYPIAGGPISTHAQWEIQSSAADSSNEKALHPNEWIVSLMNNSDSRASFKVFVVCATANSVNGNT